MTNKIRTADDRDRLCLSLAPIDQAFRASESHWGVGRLERLISTDSLTRYKRGWDMYRVALEEGDADAVAAIAPKMIAALAAMAREATAAGHGPLDPSTWEAPMAGGEVLVVCRTNAEAHAVLRGAMGRGEGNLSPDLTLAVRAQHEGRALQVWTLAEIAHLIAVHGSVAGNGGVKWEGTPAPSGVQASEGAVADVVRSGYPLDAQLSF